MKNKKITKTYSFILKLTFLACFILGLSQYQAQCSVDYFGFFGDTPTNTPNATAQNGITGVTASAMTGGPGITLNNVTESGSTGSASVFQM